jgi:hypothetical protein
MGRVSCEPISDSMSSAPMRTGFFTRAPTSRGILTRLGRLTLVLAQGELDKSCWQEQLAPPLRQRDAALSNGATGLVPRPLSFEMRGVPPETMVAIWLLGLAGSARSEA